MSQMPTPNLGADLQRIHRAVSRGLSVAHENCQTFVAEGFPDRSTAEGFWRYCAALGALTRAHHLSEDELFFPFLRDRIPGVDFDALGAQHREMEAILEAMKAASEASSLDDMCASLSRLDQLLASPHRRGRAVDESRSLGQDREHS